MTRRYDHRIRNMIVRTGNPDLFPELQIPRSTTRGWLASGPARVVTIPEFEHSTDHLIAEINSLRSLLAKTEARTNLVKTTVSILGFQLQYKRVPSAAVKTVIIETVKEAAKVVGLESCLELINLSKARFSAWLTRQKQCKLEDQTTCGRLSPTKLLTKEVTKIKDLILNPAFRHFSITSLALFARRENLVQASDSMWHRVKRQFNLRRPGQRHYPQKPRIGIRASAPGQIWHLDLTIIKLKDGTKCFIQGVLDNFSRYVLAWRVTDRYGGASTKELLLESLEKVQSVGLNVIPNVMVDGGTENYNSEVDSLVDQGFITRTLAQIEIDFSNSLIEALFLRLKHWHLFLQQLPTIEKLTEHTDFYLNECNNKIPMAVLGGATPYEMITGQWNDDSKSKLKTQSKLARVERMEFNLSRTCPVC